MFILKVDADDEDNEDDGVAVVIKAYEKKKQRKNTSVNWENVRRKLIT